MRIFVLIFSLISLASGYEVASQKLLSKDSSKETSFVGRWQVKFKMVDGDEKNVVLVAQENGMGSKETSFVGRWQVKFKMVDGDEKNVVLVAQENGMGSFELLDTGPDNKPVLTPQPATWSKTLDKISVSSNLELPIGTCCRETGTLILKAKFASGSSF